MRAIYFATQGTHSVSSCNFYPQMLVVFLRVTQNKPYLTSTPQALEISGKLLHNSKPVRVGKSFVLCDFQGLEWENNRQELQGDSSHCTEELSKQRASESAILVLVGNGFLSLEVSKQRWEVIGDQGTGGSLNGGERRRKKSPRSSLLLLRGNGNSRQQDCKGTEWSVL